ncbi:hypothetical protein FH627_27700, partial [Klebsiella pneumoniae]
KSAQIREILISESAWEEMTCLFAPSLGTLSYPPAYSQLCKINQHLGTCLTGTREPFLPLHKHQANHAQLQFLYCF